MKKIFIALFVFTVFTAFSQHTIYVNGAVINSGDGTSWNSAFKTINEAIEVSESGDSIWVAAGVYKPTGGNNRAIAFTPKSGTKLYGGFSGTETTPEQRDMVHFQTILSGDIDGDNSVNIMYLRHTSYETLIDGFIFEKGYASEFYQTIEPYYREDQGAAIFIDGEGAAATAEIRNCIFRDNYAGDYGGAVLLYGPSQASAVWANFTNCRFENNESRSFGGAVCRFGHSSPGFAITFKNCDFLNNKSEDGGAINLWQTFGDDTLIVERCTFINNNATFFGGAINVLLRDSSAFTAAVDSCDFTANLAKRGSAISIEESNYFEGYYSRSLGISNSHFLNNLNSPGGLYLVVHNTRSNLESITTLYKNVVRDYNHNNYLLGLNPVVEGMCKMFISGNDIMGKSVLLYSKKTRYNELKLNRLEGLAGERLVSFSSITDIKNNLFRSNALPADPNQFMVDAPTNICSGNLFSASKSMLPLLNFSPDTIHFYNTAIDIPYDPALFDNAFYHYLFDNCHFTASWPTNNTALIYYGAQNIFGSDPVFVDPGTGDYRLQPCSPLVDAGINTVVDNGETDLDGQPRINNVNVDIGPYEFIHSTASISVQTTPACPGQQNGTAIVTIPDLCGGVVYSWLSSNGIFGSSLDNLAAGSYIITITDINSQVYFTDFFIDELPAPAINFQTNATGCYIPGGFDVTLSGASGNAPYTFDWGNNISDTIRLGLDNGIYEVTVTDSKGCSATTSITISNPDSIAADAQINPATTPFETNGSIVLTPSGGTGSYSVLWSTGDNTLQVNDLGIGFYTVTVTDANGCSNIFIFEVSWAESVSDVGNAAIKIWPNPATESLMVSPPQLLNNFHFSIRDDHGRVIRNAFRTGSAAFKVVVSDLPSGSYIWQIDNKYSGTFIKQ